MSVAGILSSSLYGYGTQAVQSPAQKFQQEFQQLGKDLQSGSLSAAQSDFATLQQSGPGARSASSAQSNVNPIAQEFSQLSHDLQSGDLSAAQQDFTTLQQELQSQSVLGHGHHHHHNADSGGGSNSNTSGLNAIGQLIGQLSQALQSGSLSSAQQAYTALQQDFQQFAQNNGIGSSAPASSNSVSISA